MEKQPLRGRQAEAARNDGAILTAARDVFLADPRAPVSAVAERAGVGISALYRRYPGKEDLLRTLCHHGLGQYLAAAEAALDDPNGREGLHAFLREVVEQDVHALTVRLAGTFAPTDEMRTDAVRSGQLTTILVDRAYQAGLRADVSVHDVAFVLEACSAITVADPERTRQLRLRYLAMLLAGMDSGADLPGPAPGPAETGERWR